MAMFLCGLESAISGYSNYNAWTFTNIVPCGRSLTLSSNFPSQDLSSTGNWTLLQGQPVTIEAGRFCFNSAGTNQMQYNLPIAYSGDFDLRLDYDSPVRNSALRFQVNFSGGSYLAYNAGQGSTSIFSNGASPWSVATATPTPTTLRITRNGSGYNLYSWDDSKQNWNQWSANKNAWYNYSPITQAVSIYTVSAPTGDIYYLKSLFNAIPNVTQGVATSPVLDTVDGFRGVGWFQDPAASGASVLVQYRTSPYLDMRDNPNYQTATNWQEVVSSSSNRFVQINMTMSYSGYGPGPVVGPIFINGSLDQFTSNLLFTKLGGTTCRHTTNNGVLGLFANPLTSQGSTWGRSALGVGSWLNYQNGTQLTESNTAYNLANILVTGINQTINYYNNSAQLNVEAANYILQGIYAGRKILLPNNNQLIPEQIKLSWTSGVNAWINQVQATNWNSFSISNMVNMAAIYNWESGNYWNMTPPTGEWSNSSTSNITYKDSDTSSYWSTLNSSMLQGGVFQDNSGHIGDIYTSVVARTLAATLIANPNYANKDAIKTWLQSYTRSSLNRLCRDGWAIRFGRSGHANSLTADATSLVLATSVIGSGYGFAREYSTRAIWEMLKTQWVYTGDRLYGYSNIKALNSQLDDTTSPPEADTVELLSDLGVLASYSELYNHSPTNTLTIENTSADPGWGRVDINGPDTTYPKISLVACNYDNTSNHYQTRYYSSVVMPEKFPPNTQTANTNQPSPECGGLRWQDSTYANSTSCLLPISYNAATLGKAAGIARSGQPYYFTSSVNGSPVSNVNSQEVVWARGKHVVMLSKISMSNPDSRSISGYGFASAPIPLGQTNGLSNIISNNNYAYVESPDGSQSVFVQGLTPSLQTPGSHRVGTQWLTTPGNRENFTGSGVDVTNTTVATGLSSPLYCAADFAYSFSQMNPQQECQKIYGWNNIQSDVFTFLFDPTGTPEHVYLAVYPQTLNNFSISSYNISGVNVHMFSGKSGSPDFWGGDSINSVSYNGLLLGTLAIPGNLAVNRVSSNQTRVWTAGTDTAIYNGMVPQNNITVQAYQWDGSIKDVTSQCLITTNSSVIIPSSTVNNYLYGGIAIFDVLSSGTISQLPNPITRTKNTITPAPNNPTNIYTGGVVFGGGVLQNQRLFDNVLGTMNYPYKGIHNSYAENKANNGESFVTTASASGTFSTMTQGQYVILTFNHQLAGQTTSVLVNPASHKHHSQNSSIAWVNSRQLNMGWWYVNGLPVVTTYSRDNIGIENNPGSYSSPSRLTWSVGGKIPPTHSLNSKND